LGAKFSVLGCWETQSFAGTSMGRPKVGPVVGKRQTGHQEKDQQRPCQFGLSSVVFL